MTSLLAVSLLLAFLILPSTVRAGDQDQRRILIGMNLFPAVLAADNAITSKTGGNGRLTLLLLYRSGRAEAQRLVSRFADSPPIRGIATDVRIASIDQLSDYEKRPPAGIFLTEQAPDLLSRAIDFGERHHVLVFSPFEGDVERGVSAGIYVSDQILPYVNLRSLERSDIVLRPFFLEVAKHYD